MVVMMQTQSLQLNGKTGAPPCLSAVCMYPVLPVSPPAVCTGEAHMESDTDTEVTRHRLRWHGKRECIRTCV